MLISLPINLNEAVLILILISSKPSILALIQSEINSAYEMCPPPKEAAWRYPTVASAPWILRESRVYSSNISSWYQKWDKGAYFDAEYMEITILVYPSIDAAKASITRNKEY